MQNAYRDHSLLRKDRGWSFHDFNFVENLKLRGFDRIPEAAIGGPKDDLPGFHFRDDGFRLWDVIYEYTGLHLAQMYSASGACRSLVLGDASGRAACNEAVQNDTLLHELYFELSDEFHANIAGEVPKFYQGFAKLRKFLATIIFQASAQHSGVNFGQVGSSFGISSMHAACFASIHVVKRPCPSKPFPTLVQLPATPSLTPLQPRPFPHVPVPLVREPTRASAAVPRV